MSQERKIPSSPQLNVHVGPEAGPPMLFLHGITRRWQDFLPILPAFTTRWQCHALDFRGHGLSDRHPSGQYPLASYADDGLAVVRACFQEPAVVFGHSLGALTALGLAAREPQAVRALVLEDPPGAELIRNLARTPFHPLFSGMHALAGTDRPIAEVAASLAEIRLPASGGATVRLGDLRDATLLRFSAQCLRDVDPKVLETLLAARWLEGSDIQAWASAVHCPVLLLRGSEKLGGMLSKAEASGLAGAMADCTLIDLPDVGHLIHWMEPATTLRLATGFVESLR